MNKRNFMNVSNSSVAPVSAKANLREQVKHSQKKETKEKATLSRLTLCCSASWAAIELTLTNHKNRDLLRGSNKRLLKSPINLALLGTAAGVSDVSDRLQTQVKVFTHG